VRTLWRLTLIQVQGAYKLSEDFVAFVSITHSERNIWSMKMFTLWRLTVTQVQSAYKL
jgi:hypothetical protein